MAFSAVYTQAASFQSFTSIYDHQENDLAADSTHAIAKYDFRPVPRLAPRLRTTWVDEDESGDFDPTGKLPKVAQKTKREQADGNDEHSGRPTPKKPKLITWQSGRKQGLSCPVMFKLTSERGGILLKYLMRFPDNWPVHDLEAGNRGGIDTELIQQPVQPQLHRQRRKTVLDQTSSSHHQLEWDLPPLQDITLGHPAARGCKGCFELRIPCPLLQEGERYPCQGCKEDDIDCELILEPARKRPCERCRRRKIVCWYRATDNHSRPCQDCDKAGYKCVAGPVSGRTRRGPCLDQDLKHFVPTPERLYKSCTDCRKNHKSCSLQSGPISENCNRCKSLDQDCTFEAVATKPLSEVRIKATKDSVALKADSKHKDRSSAGIIKKIKTRLTHPINFNYHAVGIDSEACHWCEDQLYGIIGLAEVHVEVIDYLDGKGFIEVEGGHTAAGKAPSRMCRLCTMTRLRIAACKDHQIGQIEGLDSDMFDHETVVQWLTSDVYSSVPFDWCCLCPSLATFGCCTPELVDAGSQDEGEPGCGLKLCSNCAWTLVNDFEGNLTRAIAAMEDDKSLSVFEIRADVNFLRSDGHLLDMFYMGR
ncbi:hypothetical protein MMC19_005156 [Ptychographa xylographoides]|nr:hypothetical protein [Ptychographa xylographoides]